MGTAAEAGQVSPHFVLRGPGGFAGHAKVVCLPRGSRRMITGFRGAVCPVAVIARAKLRVVWSRRNVSSIMSVDGSIGRSVDGRQ